MKKKILIIFICALILGVVSNNVFAAQQEQLTQYHGADSTFKAEGISLIWGILKGDTENTSWVYIRMFTTEEVRKQLVTFCTTATDPFSGEIKWIITGEKLKEINIIKLNRELFKDFPHVKILFYKNIEIKDYVQEKSDLSIYYLGLPDTSPEFLSLEELENYFISAAKRLEKIEATIKK